MLGVLWGASLKLRYSALSAVKNPELQDILLAPCGNHRSGSTVNVAFSFGIIAVGFFLPLEPKPVKTGPKMTGAVKLPFMMPPGGGGGGGGGPPAPVPEPEAPKVFIRHAIVHLFFLLTLSSTDFRFLFSPF